MIRREFTIWKVVDVDPRYEVSNMGLVRRRLPGTGTFVGRITQGGMRSDGYLQLYVIPGFNMMHQLVAHVFLGPAPPGKIPNHKNGVRHDNRVSNLEYMTHGENIQHGHRVLTPHRKEHRRRVAIQNISVNHGKPVTVYQRTDLHRAQISSHRIEHTPWWVVRGYSSIHEAIAAKE